MDATFCKGISGFLNHSDHHWHRKDRLPTILYTELYESITRN